MDGELGVIEIVNAGTGGCGGLPGGLPGGVTGASEIVTLAVAFPPAPLHTRLYEVVAVRTGVVTNPDGESSSDVGQPIAPKHSSALLLQLRVYVPSPFAVSFKLMVGGGVTGGGVVTGGGTGTEHVEPLTSWLGHWQMVMYSCVVPSMHAGSALGGVTGGGVVTGGGGAGGAEVTGGGSDWTTAVGSAGVLPP